MQQPVKLNYKVYQGSTFQQTYRWESETKVYVPISSVAKSAPCIITTEQNHVLPTGWRFRVVGVAGMKEINSGSDDFYLCTATTATTIEINAINSLLYSTYTSGGVVEYNQPVDLQNYTARMQIRTEVSSETVIHEATSQNGQIVLDNTLKTISLTIPATTTASWDFETAEYSIELITGGSVVIPFLVGGLTLIKEITR